MKETQVDALKLNKNLTMLTDFYEFTMANGYYKKGMGDTIAYFDMFYRNVPDNAGYSIMAGVVLGSNVPSPIPVMIPAS